MPGGRRHLRAELLFASLVDAACFKRTMPAVQRRNGLRLAEFGRASSPKRRKNQPQRSLSLRVRSRRRSNAAKVSRNGLRLAEFGRAGSPTPQKSAATVFASPSSVAPAVQRRKNQPRRSSPRRVRSRSQVDQTVERGKDPNAEGEICRKCRSNCYEACPPVPSPLPTPVPSQSPYARPRRNLLVRNPMSAASTEHPRRGRGAAATRLIRDATAAKIIERGLRLFESGRARRYPSELPTALPTTTPTISSYPTELPSPEPTGLPSSGPTPNPSGAPTPLPTYVPTTARGPRGSLRRRGGADSWPRRRRGRSTSRARHR